MIISPINNHANRAYSHRTGWGRMWAKCLKTRVGFNTDWSIEKTVYLEHGMEWKEGAKSINYFLTSEKQLKELAVENQQRIAEGKLPKESSWEKLTKKAKMFEGFKGTLFSLDIDCPMYGTLLKTRIRPWVPDVFKNLDFDKIDKVCRSATTIKQSDLDRSFFILGDSHSLAVWDYDAKLCRLDGQTLNGAIDRGFDTWIKEFNRARKITTLRTYFGNIDIRHHTCRLNTNKQKQISETKNLVIRYFKELERVKKLYDIETIQVVEVLLVENIKRKLPKTGYHKGKPYWGTWQERADVVTEFNRITQGLCKRLTGYEFIPWPSSFKNTKGELDIKYMERPQSVHISPEHYLWRIQ